MRKQAVVENLRKLADSIEALITDEQQVTGVEEVTVPVTFKELKSAFAALVREGKQKQAKEIITKYDAKKLSDVPKDKYQEVLNEARKI